MSREKIPEVTTVRRTTWTLPYVSTERVLTYRSSSCCSRSVLLLSGLKFRNTSESKASEVNSSQTLDDVVQTTGTSIVALLVGTGLLIVVIPCLSAGRVGFSIGRSICRSTGSLFYKLALAYELHI
jgi:hypothetical protein